nr:hypothetical protein [Tanacetum cinerariifolium]
NLDVKWLSRSEMTDIGIPCRETISFMYNLDSCMIKSLKLPKSGNQLQFLIQRVPSGRTLNALSIPRRFSALMSSSLIASAWASRICDGNLG